MTKKKNPAEVAMAKQRAKKLSKKRRVEIASMGGQAFKKKMQAKSK